MSDDLLRDKARLDWLQSVLTPDNPATEVFFAGLRRGANPAIAFQCEVAPAGETWMSFSGETLRDAIDSAARWLAPARAEAER